VEKKMTIVICLLFFFTNFLVKLKNISENKKFGHCPHTMGYMFVPFSTFLLYLVSEVACSLKMCSLLAFFANFATIKNFFPKV